MMQLPDGFVAHDGGLRRVHDQALVTVIYRGQPAKPVRSLVKHFDWSHMPRADEWDIIAYRVERPSKDTEQ